MRQARKTRSAEPVESVEPVEPAVESAAEPAVEPAVEPLEPVKPIERCSPWIHAAFRFKRGPWACCCQGGHVSTRTYLVARERGARQVVTLDADGKARRRRKLLERPEAPLLKGRGELGGLGGRASEEERSESS